MGRGWGNVEIVLWLFLQYFTIKRTSNSRKSFQLTFQQLRCVTEKSLSISNPNWLNLFQIHFLPPLKMAILFRFILLHASKHLEFIFCDLFRYLFVLTNKNIWHQINLQTFGLIQLLYWGTFYECFSIKNYSLNLAITFLQFSEPKPRIHFRQRCLNLFSKDLSFELVLPWK